MTKFLLHVGFMLIAPGGVMFLATSRADGAEAAVSFDVPAIAVAQLVNPAVVEQATTGGKLVRIRLPISTFQRPDFHGLVEQCVVEVSSPYLSMRIVDYWPKTEVASDIQGTVSVKHSTSGESQLGGKGTLGYQPLGAGTLDAGFKTTNSREESYQRMPPMQVLSSSGTIRRGHGVFFKFLYGPHSVLEGAREIAILAEVPEHWRAQMLHVSMTALGGKSSRGGDQVLGATQLWTVAYQEGDSAAAAQASRYVTQERALRVLAASSQAAVAEKSLPSVWHKLGAALDVVEPRIPADYLNKVIFGAKNQYFDNQATNRLPVVLRVAILDYWEERERLAALSQHPDARDSISATNRRNTRASLSAL